MPLKIIQVSKKPLCPIPLLTNINFYGEIVAFYLIKKKCGFLGTEVIALTKKLWHSIINIKECVS